MKPISERFSSMKLTTAILAVLILWFVWGILLSNSDIYVPGFRMMNSTLLPVWFRMSEGLSKTLKIWFAGLCFVMIVLAGNLVFCSWTRMIGILRNRLIRHKVLMFIIHVVFGLVVLGHLASFLLGYRYENVRLQQGETFSLPDGYALTVTDVHFADDPGVLKKPPKQLGPNEYHPKMNLVAVVLKQKGSQVTDGRISFLHPLTHKDIQVSLKRFTPPKGRENQKDGARKPGVVLIISKNPVKSLVFVLFPMMIAGIGIYMGMTWRLRHF